MKPLCEIVCYFKGHLVNPNESIVRDNMEDERNWLCQCHRCGLFLMHDGATSGGTIVMGKEAAMKVKQQYEAAIYEALGNAPKEE